MEDLGVRGDEIILLVISNIDCRERRGGGGGLSLLISGANWWRPEPMSPKIRQRLKAADSKRVNSRDRVELFVRKINEAKEIFR